MKWQKARVVPGNEPHWSDRKELYVLIGAPRTLSGILEDGSFDIGPTFITNIVDKQGLQMGIAQEAVELLPIFRPKVALVSLEEFKAGARA